MRKPTKAELRLIMALLLALGLALIMLATCAPKEWVASALREVGGACLIAAILGFTVHEWLSSQIARDAFEGAMGYVLQENLREEIKWITRIDRIARKFDLTVTIEPISDAICRITTATYKVIENISDRPINLTAMLWLDDWGYEQKSDVVECEIRASGQTIATLRRKEKIRSSVKGETGEVEVSPSATVEIFTKGIEYKPHNSDLHLATSYPIESVRVTVKAPENIDWDVYANNRVKHKPQRYNPTVEFEGTVLPDQRIVVRWYPRRTDSDSTVSGSPGVG